MSGNRPILIPRAILHQRKSFPKKMKEDNLMDHFKDKIAIVTGGASGIGHALCDELGQRGAVVIVADINIRGAEQVASAITKIGGRARAEHLDVTHAEEVQKMVDNTVSEHGRLDYMFNNAGILIVGETYDMNVELWNRILEINLRGAVYGTTAAYPLMAKQGFGHIVNTASLFGVVPLASATAYATTKHALVGLSTSLRAEAAGLGVKVSVICPGFIQTPAYDVPTVLNAKREDVFAAIPFKLMNAKEAARVILRAVARNQKILVFPFYARLFWWLYRIHPTLAAPLAHGLIKKFRALRSSSEPLHRA